MALENVGFVGWRGMVGSVLLDRMRAENVFRGLEPVFYSTSQVGQTPPDVGVGPIPTPRLADAYDVNALSQHDAIVSCQGGDYTKQVLPKLRELGWEGYWIDAASAKRLDQDSVIVLDPVNRPVIDRAIADGMRNYIGGNCTVSLMLMALDGLFREGWVEWVSAMTYQAASGAGAQAMRELVAQMDSIGSACRELVADPKTSILEIDRQVRATQHDEALPLEAFGVPIAGSLIPWIDGASEGGRTREESKAHSESNKILANDPEIPVDGICVRVGAMRCHSQAFTIKLKQDVPLDEIESAMDGANDWVRVVPNDLQLSKQELSPAQVTGTLDIPVGRIHKLQMGPEYLSAFTVGDQLLWGAAEPLRRVLNILREGAS
jgi:aspartate-semialdehyde dehydrogenase